MKQSDLPEDNLHPAIAWISRFNELSLRERGVICFATLCSIGAIWYFLLDTFLSAEVAKANRAEKLIRSEIALTEDEHQELIRLSQIDPNDATRKELDAVAADIAAMDRSLASSLSQFIPPSSMTLVLKDVMADHSNLTLTRLNRLPARELLPDEEDVNLFLHPIEIELEGPYLDVLQYVHALEHGDWQFNWRSFDFKTKGYPNGVASLEIETLSRNKSWLGI